MYKNIFFISIILFFLAMPLAADENKTIKEKHFTGNIELTKEQIKETKKKFTHINSIKLNELAKKRILENKPMFSVKEEEYTLPVQVDNSLLPAFPPIRYQGQVASCNAFAIGYYQLTYTFGQKYDWNNKNDDNSKKFSPKWAYNLTNNGLNYGSSIVDTYNLLIKHGSIFWDKFPYTEDPEDVSDWPLDGEIWKEAVYYRIKGVGIIDNTDEESGLTLLKHALLNGEIYVFTTYVYSWNAKQISDNPESSEDDNEVGKTACYLVNDTNGSHTIAIVGYNDDIWVDINENGIMEEGEKGALKLANSWGTNWGNDGYIWLSYDAFRAASLVLDNETGRRTAINSGVVYKILLQDDEKPRVICEVSISHARRSHLKVTLGISDYNKNEPELTWEPQMLNYNRGYSFDGSGNVSEAVFAFDFSDLIEDFATIYYYPYKWYLIINDDTLDFPTEIKSMKLIDVQGNNYEVLFNAALPIIFDNDTETLTTCYTPRMGSKNYPPIVDAGKNIYLKQGNNMTILNGRVIDDIIHDTLSLGVKWSTISGPGVMRFYPDSFPISLGWFSKPGIYNLQLQANDAEYRVEDMTKVVLFDKSKIWSSDGVNGENFGHDVDIFENEAVISTLGKNSVYIFQIDDNGEWEEKQIIKPPFNYEENTFGYSIDIDDKRLIVGAHTYDIDLLGKAFIYEKNDDGIWENTAELTSPINNLNMGFFGEKVAISGNTAMVCEPFGNQMFDEDLNPIEEGGTIYVYEKNEYGIWSEVGRLKSDQDSFGNGFGNDMCMENNTVITKCEGCIYVFERISGVWTKTQKIFNPDASAGVTSNFRKISLQENTIAISGVTTESTGTDTIFTDIIYIYEKDTSGNWINTSKIYDPDPHPYPLDRIEYNFGEFLDIYNDIIAVKREHNYLKIEWEGLKVNEEYEMIIFKRDQNGNWVEKEHFRPVDQKLEGRKFISGKLYGNKLLIGDVTGYGINAEFPGSGYIYIINTEE